MDWTFLSSGIVMLIFGLCMVGTGIFGLVRRRPFAFSAKTIMWFFVLFLLPNFVSILTGLFRHWDPFALLLLALSTIMIFALGREIKGYMIIGIYDRTFREALASALNALDVHLQETILKRRSQETITRIRLVELDADVQAAIREWSGIARIHIEQRQQAHLLRTIANGINEYYSSTSAKVNNIAFVVYLMVGIIVSAMAAVLTFAS